MKKMISTFSLLLFCFTNMCFAGATGNSFYDLTLQELQTIADAREGDRYRVGDIIIEKNELKIFSATDRQLWTNGVFIIEYDDGVTAIQRTRFDAACNAWTNNTGITCVERTNEPNFVRVSTHNGSGCLNAGPNVSCSDSIGMRGGRQNIEIAENHWTSDGVLQHEIGHALGFIHEHSRSDRDRFLSVVLSNAVPGQSGQFRKVSSSRNHTDYDYDSIMHYQNCSFAKDNQCDGTNPATEHLWTLVPVPCERFQVGFSVVTPLDLEGARVAYGGAVAGLFLNSRRAECGSHTYNINQVTAACGNNCANASAPVWSRLHTSYERGCGWLPRRNGPLYCTGRGQEYKDQWHDRDHGHISCWGGTLVERWTQCGCSTQELQANCADTSLGVIAAKLQQLLNSSDPKERRTAQLIKRSMKYEQGGHFDSQLSAAYLKFAIPMFVQAKQDNISAILCELKIALTIGRLRNPQYKMSLAEYKHLLKRNGIKL